MAPEKQKFARICSLYTYCISYSIYAVNGRTDTPPSQSYLSKLMNSFWILYIWHRRSLGRKMSPISPDQSLNSRASGTEGYEHWRQMQKWWAQSAASAFSSPPCPVPQGKVAAAHFKALRPPESHRGRHRRQRDTPGCNWQLSTLVSRCHFLCQFAPRHICRPWNNTPRLAF